MGPARVCWEIGRSFALEYRNGSRPDPIFCAAVFLCLTNLRPIHIAARRTKGMPMPNPTPRPTPVVSKLELPLIMDCRVSETLVWAGVIKVELIGELIVDEVVIVDVLDEVELVVCDVKVPWGCLVMLKEWDLNPSPAPAFNRRK